MLTSWQCIDIICCNDVKVGDMGVQMVKKVVATVGRDLLMNLDAAVEDVVCISL